MWHRAPCWAPTPQAIVQGCPRLSTLRGPERKRCSPGTCPPGPAPPGHMLPPWQCPLHHPRRASPGAGVSVEGQVCAQRGSVVTGPPRRVCLPVALGLSHPSCSDDWNLSLSLSVSRLWGGGLLLWREEGLRVKSPLIPIWLGWLLSDWERKWLVICLGVERGLVCVPLGWEGVRGAGRGLTVGWRKRSLAPRVCLVAVSSETQDSAASRVGLAGALSPRGLHFSRCSGEVKPRRRRRRACGVGSPEGKGRQSRNAAPCPSWLKVL